MLYIKNICINVIESNKLSMLYISIDGVPTMSKINEQKKRRYTSYMIDEISKKIFDRRGLISGSNNVKSSASSGVEWITFGSSRPPSNISEDINSL